MLSILILVLKLNMYDIVYTFLRWGTNVSSVALMGSREKMLSKLHTVEIWIWSKYKMAIHHMFWP